MDNIFEDDDAADKFDAMDRRKMDMDNSYAPPSQLKVDPQIKDRFREAGFYLKWVRFRAGEGGIDSKNLRRRMHPSEGYTFVSPKEMDAMDLISVGDVESYGGSEIITSGDLVLMKVRIEKAEARRAYYQGRTREQSQAISQRLRENNVQNGTRSVVRTGKNAHFSS